MEGQTCVVTLLAIYMKISLLDDQIPNVLGMTFPVGSSNISAKGLSLGGNELRK